MRLDQKIHFHLFMILLLLPSVQAQTFFSSNNYLNYRFSLTSESGYHQLNDTPLNIANKFVPQIRSNSYCVVDLFMNIPFLALDFQVNGNYSDRDKPDYHALVRELYVDQPLGDYFHFTLGRKILKWGTGYAFNPTGVVEPGKNAIDPSDRLSQLQGRQIMALDAFIGSNSLTLIFANEVRYAGSIKWRDSEVAARCYALIKNVDFSLIGYWREHGKSKLGFNTAWTHGSHLELHSEFMAQKGTQKRYHLALDSSGYQIYFDRYPYRARFQNSSQIFSRLLLGAQFTFDSGVSLMAEYFYNREGLTDSEWNQWRKFTLFHQRQIIIVPPNPRSLPDFYHALSTLSQEGSLRHYGFFRFYKPMQKSSFELSTFLNLSDGSGVIIPVYNYLFSPNIKAWLRISCFFGAESSEFGMLFSKRWLQLGMKISF